MREPTPTDLASLLIHYRQSFEAALGQFMSPSRAVSDTGAAAVREILARVKRLIEGERRNTHDLELFCFEIEIANRFQDAMTARKAVA